MTALWAPDRRAATVGIVLLVTLTAFERMGVTTAMPRLVAELHGEELYAWPFLSFLVASVVATVLAGQLCDRYGPARVVMAGPALFLVGLLVAGFAPSIPVLLAGRVLQGLGAGTQTVVSTVLIGLVYPERDRPAAFGAVSAAWVLPALIGPAVSGVVTERIGWRFVFLGLVPLVVVAALLLVPVLRRLPEHDGAPPRQGRLLAAVGAAAGVAGLSWAAQHPSAVMVALGLASLAVLYVAQRSLLPAGTLLARRGLPVTILARGLLAGAYFSCVAYVPLTLTVVHGFDPLLAGLPLTVGSLGWASASAWQGRHRDLARPVLLRWGFVFVAAGVATLSLVAPAWGVPWVALPAMALAGAGMGLGVSSVSVLTLAASTPSDRGFNSSAMWLADQLGSAVLVGIGGILVPAAGAGTLNLLMAGVAVVGAVVTGPRVTSPGPGGHRPGSRPPRRSAG
ncbi:MFS transporter [Actinocrispum wychmicini]|uniref:Putative MFS family arabinose efflux permease n=1 Tax=Actinocrispum wychmicini TaxID=1213861 RepID=A0A4R2K362_9PSEU|nr:MFS transporter [Actinocrispum wychmicini]TCO60735.1 putative MFS family arabinose efflux permease [Actinocrispum wychmicini]